METKDDHSDIILKVAICGGGNAVHVLASDLGRREEYSVYVYAPYQDEAERFNEGLLRNGGFVSRTYRGTVTRGSLHELATSNAEIAISDADVILLAIPSFTHEKMIQSIAPYIKDGAIIVALPGQGGFDYVCQSILKEKLDKVIIAGTNQLPYQCRILEYGSMVDLIGFKTKVGVATVPGVQANNVANILSNMIETTTFYPLPHYMSITLCPGNQVIHPSIMHGLFHTKEDYFEPPLFYQNTDDYTASIMKGLSNDLQSIAKAFEERTKISLHVPKIDDMMRLFYANEIEDPSTIRSIFCTNKGYTGLKAPMIRIDGSLNTEEGTSSDYTYFRPDYDYRYLTEDIPFGLCVCKGIADLLNIETPFIDKIVLWAQRHMNKEFIVDGKLIGRDVGFTQSPQKLSLTQKDILKV
jgi:opine dehydrogenase